MTLSTGQQSVDVGTKLIGEFVNDAYTLRIEAPHDMLECRASITVHDAENSISPAELISILGNQEITTTVDLEQIAIFCSEAAEGDDPQQCIIARGKEAITGKDGWLELAVTTGKEAASLAEDDLGRVDFKSVQTFTNVAPGQQIGSINLPTAGEPGETITGEVIPATEGNPCNVIAGNGVRFSEDGTQFFAEEAGRAVFDNNVLSVAEELVITGDVDLSVGHINFNGFVDIKGDVLDDFDINAAQGVKVSGAVGACQIYSEGSVTIGTMAGLGVGKIVCKGDLQARYLNQVTVECWGDVHVSNELRNSVVKATGSINVPKGIITGGETVALEGVEAKILGARVGVKTIITSGIYFPETDRLQYLRKQVKSLNEQIKRIGPTLTTLTNKPFQTLRKALREATELRIGILTQRQVNLDEEREELTEELLSFTADEHPTANPKVNVLSAVKEGVFINLGETSEEITTEMSGPVSIIENTQLGGFRYHTYSPLNVAAETIEEEPTENESLEKEPLAEESSALKTG